MLPVLACRFPHSCSLLLFISTSSPSFIFVDCLFSLLICRRPRFYIAITTANLYHLLSILDLRPSESNSNNPNPNYVTRAQGERVAQQIGARAYKECSALSASGVDDVFEAATRASMLMREGVPTHARTDSGPAAGGVQGHRRKSSGQVPVAGGGKGKGEDEEGSGKCCVVC
jgi:hypothetical protein